jgi:DNA-binding response OmpR family regulator
MDDADMIAVIEDPFIRRLLRDILKKYGYRVVEASAAEAVEALRSGVHNFRLVITNSPSDFLPFAAEVPLLYLAADPDPDLAARFTHCRALQKPFVARELVEAVRDLAGYQRQAAG